MGSVVVLTVALGPGPLFPFSSPQSEGRISGKTKRSVLPSAQSLVGTCQCESDVVIPFPNLASFLPALKDGCYVGGCHHGGQRPCQADPGSCGNPPAELGPWRGAHLGGQGPAVYRCGAVQHGLWEGAGERPLPAMGVGAGRKRARCGALSETGE